MRLLIVIALLFLIAVPAMAQQGITFGMAYANEGTPQLMGCGTYDQSISGPLFSYSGYNILPIWQGNSKLPQLQFTAFTGLALRVATMGKLQLFVQGAGGLASTGDVTTGAANYGGFGHIAIGRGWGLIVGGEGNYSPISGTNATLRLGVRYGVK
jgi:hypothetical protein